MELGNRLGLAGIILGFFAIAAPYLWPEKKWIGWLSLSLACVLLGMWGWLEFKSIFGTWYREYPIKSTAVAFLCGGIIASSLWLLLNKKTPSTVSKDKQAELPAEVGTEKSKSDTPKSPPQFLIFANTAFVLPDDKHIFAENKPIQVALNIVNRSVVGVAKDVLTFAGTAFIPADNESGLSIKEEDQFLQFRSSGLAMLPRMHGDEIAAGDNRVRDTITKPLQPELVKGLEEEMVYFYVFGILKWTDDEGTWETQICSHLLVKRSKLGQGRAIWKECVSGAKHNFVRHPFVP
jgi:hypothetical protein